MTSDDARRARRGYGAMSSRRADLSVRDGHTRREGGESRRSSYCNNRFRAGPRRGNRRNRGRRRGNRRRHEPRSRLEMLRRRRKLQGKQHRDVNVACTCHEYSRMASVMSSKKRAVASNAAHCSAATCSDRVTSSEFSRPEITCPSVRPIERAMREPRMDPQSTVFPARPYRP